jgi:23S rRNA (pseudouridine1915-N3)-methyltransferase
MAERFHVLLVGRPRAKWGQLAVDDYSKRIRRMGGVAEHVVKAERFGGDVAAVRAAEGHRLRDAARGALVCLDERGDAPTTEAFAELVDELRQRGPVSFAIGGAYGHDPSTRAAAARTVRLSSMVLNHELARVVLYEQLYRALTLLEGIPYHH